MKKIFFLVVLFISSALFAQVTNEGQPVSWKLKNTKTLQNHVLPNFDLDALKAEDEVNDLLFDAPWRFGYKHMVDFGFENGEWIILENGNRIWRIKFTSPSAISMNVIFDEFFMPEGGKLYLYNDDRSDLLGAYTATQNLETGGLGTWLVQGETLWVEYFEPAEVAGEGRLHFESITHGYRGASSMLNEKSLGDSGDCNQDVDCPIGEDWEEYKDLNKKSVGILLSGGSGFCTGALVNNTAADGTPYFLTANHCYSDPGSWSFRFGWISPDPICATTESSTNGPTTMTISGASLRAKNAASDFCLVEIDNAIPTDWNRTFSGWDRTDDFPEFEVGIHHPSGDIMKICRDDDGAVKEVNAGAQTWEITAAGGGWELGVTEPGSSGSPLFDQDGRVIGQLYGGGAACSGTVDNDQYDYYGRFGVSWDTGSSSATRLKEWLDPTGASPATLDSYPSLETYALDATIFGSFAEVDCGVSTASPVVTLKNAGETTLTSATITWSFNGGDETIINWTGSLVHNETEAIDVGTVSFISGENTLALAVSNPNGGTDEQTSNDTATVSYNYAAFETTQVHLHLLTDNWCQETTWELRDATGTVLYSGGPYAEDEEDNTDFYYDFDVTDQCYTFEIFDTYGDGICCDNGEGFYELTTDDEVVIISGGDFGSSEANEFAIASDIGINDSFLREISIYPNPTEGVLTIETKSRNYSYSLSNTLGQVVSQGTLEETTTNLDFSNLKNGVYFIKITDTKSKNFQVKKIVIRK